MFDIEIIGYLATSIGAIQLLPELLKALKTHHLRDVAWGMLVFGLTGSLLWGTYGIMKNIIPLVISAVINCTLEIILINLKIHYSHTKRPCFVRKIQSVVETID